MNGRQFRMVLAALHGIGIAVSCSIPRMASAQTTKKAASAPAAIRDFKLTQYDREVGSPQIAVGRDGTLHVAFVEATKPGVESFVFYRSSANGGKSWTEPKNLSADIPDRSVGAVRLAVDGQGRLYAVWLVSGVPYVGLSANSRQNSLGSNLVYRVLSGGQWSPILPINAPQADTAHQHVGAGSFFVGADPTGRAHVAYVLDTDVFHPELMFGAGTSYPQHASGMGLDSIGQVDLDGSQHTPPREAFLTPVVKIPNNSKCDSLDLLDGYFDQSGAPHFVAQASAGVGEPFGQSRIVLCENGKQTPVVTLPGSNIDPPYLLTDAQGHNHVIVDFKGGAQHSVRDYAAGTGQFTVLKTESTVNHPLQGFQAGQGPSGTGIVVMELIGSAIQDVAETWLAVYDGKAWRPAVQVTNYKVRSSGTYATTGTRSSVTTVSSWSAGYTAAATFDAQGHLLLVHEGDESGNFLLQSGSAPGTGLGTKSPKLLFHRF